MPQRFLRPGITNSERWNVVPFDTQSLFIRLLTIVDDFGRCDGRTAVIAAACFAVWNETNPREPRHLQQVERMLQQLEKVGLVERYITEGKRVVQIAQWQERVRQGVRERWPCRELQQNNGELLPSSPLTLASTPSAETKKHLSVAANSCNIVKDVIRWTKEKGWEGITAADITEWKDAFPACDVERQLKAMEQWCKSNPAKAKKSNWRKFVTNWLTSQQDRGGDLRGSKNGSSTAAQRKLDRSGGLYPSNVDHNKIIQ